MEESPHAIQFAFNDGIVSLFQIDAKAGCFTNEIHLTLEQFGFIIALLNNRLDNLPEFKPKPHCATQ